MIDNIGVNESSQRGNVLFTLNIKGEQKKNKGQCHIFLEVQ